VLTIARAVGASRAGGNGRAVSPFRGFPAPPL
jgi:hypothetical protein